MARPPEPVHAFFALFLAKPDDKALRGFCIDLLDLEVSRVKFNVFLIPPLFEASERYKSDIAQARRVVRFARMLPWNNRDTLDHDLPYFWLTLLGHRLAAERGLPVQGGITALVHVASERLGLPLKEVETWPVDTFFEQFTETVLRDEWDYCGLRFRQDLPPPEEA